MSCNSNDHTMACKNDDGTWDCPGSERMCLSVFVESILSPDGYNVVGSIAKETKRTAEWATRSLPGAKEVDRLVKEIDDPTASSLGRALGTPGRQPLAPWPNLLTDAPRFSESVEDLISDVRVAWFKHRQRILKALERQDKDDYAAKLKTHTPTVGFVHDQVAQLPVLTVIWLKKDGHGHPPAPVPAGSETRTGTRPVATAVGPTGPSPGPLRSFLAWLRRLFRSPLRA